MLLTRAPQAGDAVLIDTPTGPWRGTIVSVPDPYTWIVASTEPGDRRKNGKPAVRSVASVAGFRDDTFAYEGGVPLVQADACVRIDVEPEHPERYVMVHEVRADAAIVISVVGRHVVPFESLSLLPPFETFDQLEGTGKGCAAPSVRLPFDDTSGTLAAVRARVDALRPELAALATSLHTPLVLWERLHGLVGDDGKPLDGLWLSLSIHRRDGALDDAGTEAALAALLRALPDAEAGEALPGAPDEDAAPLLAALPDGSVHAALMWDRGLPALWRWTSFEGQPGLTVIEGADETVLAADLFPGFVVATTG